jgi:hypothetical protein
MIAINRLTRQATAMDILLPADISLSQDGNPVHFVAVRPARSVQCAISRTAIVGALGCARRGALLVCQPIGWPWSA